MDSKNENIFEEIKTKFPGEVIDTHSFRGDNTIVLKKDKVIEILRFLRDDEKFSFEFLMDLTCVDYLGRDMRFEVVSHLYSFKFNRRLRIKVPVSESDCSVDSLVVLWQSANWFEREAYDMYGIVFKGHPDLRRLMLSEEFVGHPLRKDYPVAKRQPVIGPEN